MVLKNIKPPLDAGPAESQTTAVEQPKGAQSTQYLLIDINDIRLGKPR